MVNVVGGTTIPNYGLVVLSPTTDQDYWINGGPAIGQKLQIVVQTSLIASVFCSTTEGTVTITGPKANTTTYNGAISVPNVDRTASISLRGVSTTKWAVTACSTNPGGFNLTTAVA